MMKNHVARGRCTHVIAFSLAAAGVPGTVHADSPTFRTVALSGETAPGTAASFTDLSYVVVNTHGQAILHALVTGNSDGPCDIGDPPPDQGVWSEGLGSLALLARGVSQ